MAAKNYIAACDFAVIIGVSHFGNREDDHGRELIHSRGRNGG
jgi:hypothetical protein